MGGRDLDKQARDWRIQSVSSCPPFSLTRGPCVHGWSVRVNTFVQVVCCVSSRPPTRTAAFLTLALGRRGSDRRQKTTIGCPPATPCRDRKAIEVLVDDIAHRSTDVRRTFFDPSLQPQTGLGEPAAYRKARSLLRSLHDFQIKIYHDCTVVTARLQRSIRAVDARRGWLVREAMASRRTWS